MELKRKVELKESNLDRWDKGFDENDNDDNGNDDDDDDNEELENLITTKEKTKEKDNCIKILLGGKNRLNKVNLLRSMPV